MVTKNVMTHLPQYYIPSSVAGNGHDGQVSDQSKLTIINWKMQPITQLSR